MPEEIFLFKVRVQHDKGEVTFSVRATSMQNAIQQVMDSESCPERAIQMVKRVKS